MDQYEIHRIEVDNPPGVASVVVACCTQGDKFYAEYLVLHELPRGKGLNNKSHSSEVTGAAEAAKILEYALRMAKESIQAVGLGDAPGNEQYIEVLKGRYPTEMNQFRAQVNAELRCQCLKELLQPSSVGIPYRRG